MKHIGVFTHHCKTLTKLALKNVLTIYREAKGKTREKEDACWTCWMVPPPFFFSFFGRLHLKAAKLPSASERQTNRSLRSKEEST